MTVNINGKNVLQEYGLILISKNVENATPKTIMVDIPGADGKLDITDAMGVVRYQNRKINLKFEVIGGPVKTARVAALVANAYNGARVNLIFSEDPGYFYEGRVVGMTCQQKNASSELTMTVDCQPYAKTVGEFTVTITGSGTVFIAGSRMPTVPTITVADGSTTIMARGKSHSLEAGTYALHDMPVLDGLNTFEVSGTAKVTWTYRKGKL